MGLEIEVDAEVAINAGLKMLGNSARRSYNALGESATIFIKVRWLAAQVGVDIVS